MKFFTTDRIIMLCLLAILGLAIIASQNRLGEGYSNRRTRWVEYMERVEPIVKQINYFNGKNTELINQITKEKCVDWQKQPDSYIKDCEYVTDYARSGPIGSDDRPATREMAVYQGKPPPISDAKAADLIDRLTKSEIINERFKKTAPEIQSDIDAIQIELINTVGKEIYDAEIPKLTESLKSTDIISSDKTQLLDDIAFFSKIKDISPEKSKELYSKVWALANEDSTSIAGIQSMIDGIEIPDYKLKIQILRETEYFRGTKDLSEPKVAEIYAKLYADHTTIGLNKILSDYLGTIPDYTNKVTGIAASRKFVDIAYNANVPDVTYHESAEDIRARDKTVSVPVKDASGNVINLPWDQAVTTTPRYNDPGYFRFSPSPYVPNYEDSIYLSRLTQYDDKSAQVVDYAGRLPPPAGGFCAANKNNTIEIETQCGKIGKDACASTSCCVLLGGSKCVAGNEAGPTMKANYSDISVLNRDYYYYQGKCYGNCP
jgi:hypothetical protein